MLIQPRHTVLIITSDRLVRVDLRLHGAVDVIAKWEAQRPAGSELADSVLAAIHLGKHRRGRLYVLTEDVWCGSVTLVDEVIAAVPAEHLDQTLALEAEFESGLSPFDSAIGAARIDRADGASTWRVTQVDANVLNSISERLPRWAGPLVCIGPVDTGGEASCPLKSSETLRGVSQQNSAEKNPAFAWDVVARQWLTQFLEAPQKVLAARLPVTRYTASQQRRVGVMAAGIAVLICIGVELCSDQVLATSQADLRQTVEQERQLRRQFELVDSERRAIQQSEAQRLEAEKTRQRQLAEFEDRRMAYEARRRRPGELLRALSSTADAKHWVQQISLDREGATIDGVAVDSGAITALAGALEQQLNPATWRLRAADISPLMDMPLVRFRIELMADQADASVPREEEATDVR